MRSMLVLLGLPLLAGLSSGKTIQVPADYLTIQEGIDAAVDGDIVLVADGTYTGPGNKDLDFRGMNIAVRSEHGAESTVIDCENDGRGARFHSGESPECTLEGFTIRAGSAEFGGAVKTDISTNSCPSILNCIIVGNYASNRGGGVFFDTSAFLSDCLISGNVTDGAGGGVCLGSGYPVVEKCTISNNRANSQGAWNIGGGGMYICLCTPVINACRIMDNFAACFNVDGSGGITQVTADGLISNCIIYNNDSCRGGGIYLHDSSPAITNCTITQNSTSLAGGAITCYYYSYPQIVNCISWNNYSQSEIFIRSEYPSFATVTYSDIEGGWTGEGNIDIDPRFVDPGKEDFHLLFESPCIDTGCDAGIYVDIDGDSRPLGNGFDMGADEVRDGPAVRVSPESVEHQAFCGSFQTDDTLSIISVGTETLEYAALPGNEPWLTLEGDLQGRLSPGDTTDVILQFDLTAVLPGEFEDTITVISSDPYNPEIFIPVRVEIISPVTVDLYCGDPSVKRGECLSFDVALENISDQMITFDAWIDIYLISGTPHPRNPLWGPAGITLGPGSVVEESYTTSPVPGYAPLGGPYNLFLRGGKHPLKINESSFEFYVIP